jgi:hypothetical protein
MENSEIAVVTGVFLVFLLMDAWAIYQFRLGWRAWRYNEFPNSFDHRMSEAILRLSVGARAAKRREAKLRTPQVVRFMGMAGMIVSVLVFLGMTYLLIVSVISLTQL